MKTIVFLISIFVFSMFLNVFTLSLIDDYQQMIDKLPDIAEKSFITGCNKGIIKYDTNHVNICNDLGKQYSGDFKKFLDSIN